MLTLLLLSVGIILTSCIINWLNVFFGLITIDIYMKSMYIYSDIYIYAECKLETIGISLMSWDISNIELVT